jgi:glutamate transport system permease protein
MSPDPTTALDATPVPPLGTPPGRVRRTRATGASGATVLFDAPGPRTRRRVLIISLVAAALALAGIAVAVARLADNGQFDAELWGPLIDPSTEEFPLVWERLGRALLVTLQAAAVSMVLSLVLGVVLVTLRLRLGRFARLPVIGVVELLRGLPVIVAILLASVLMPRIGVDLPDFWYLVIGLTAYNSVIISEILRAGVLSLPRGQVEAGLAIGLTRRQTMALVEMPQAFRVMLPALISQLVVIVKDTALASVVINGVDDLMRQAQSLRGALDNPLQVFAVVAVMYIVINVLLDRVAVLVERRFARRRA